MAWGGCRAGAGRKPGDKSKSVRIPMRIQPEVTAMKSVKFTSNRNEEQRLGHIQRLLFDSDDSGNFYKLVMLDDSEISGYMSGINGGKRADRTGRLQYYGSVRVLTITGNEETIDLLDVKDVSNITSSEIIDQFAKLGLITIVGRD